MTSQHLLRSVLLGCLVFIRVRTARCGDPKPAAIPPAPITVDRRDAKSSIVLIGAQVIEIQGDVKGALKQAGFGYFTQINRTREGDTSFFFVEGGENEPKWNQDPLDILRKNPDTIVLCNFHMKTVMGQSANLTLSTAPNKMQYLARTGEKTFELREFVAERLGVTLQFTPKPEADEPNVLRISPLIASTTTVDARETTPGVDLEIGKPIVATRKLETSLRLVDGPNSTPVIVPGPEGRQLVLFVTAQRVHKPRPGEVLPSPLPGR